MAKNKFFALIIIIFMLFSVSGCGGGGSNASRFADIPTSQDKPVPEPESNDIPITTEPSPQSQDKPVEPVPTPTPTPEPIISHDPLPEPVRYTVSFNSNGGSDVSSITILSGNTVTQPANPSRSGYTFGGWYKDSALTQAFKFGSNGDTVTSNITLYAKWIETDILRAEEAINKISIGYQSGDSASNVTKNLTLPTSVNAYGDVSISWSSNNTSVISNSGAVTRPSVSDTVVVLTATATAGSVSRTKTFTVTVLHEATPAPSGYTVTFNSNGGSTVASIHTSSGKTINMPENPVREDYVFAGWYKDETFTEMFTFGAEGDKITRDTTLYAHWINTDILRAEYALGEIVIGYADGDNSKYVTQNLSLPTKAGDANITWASSNASIISSNGTVTRPNGSNAEVTLSATARSGTEAVTKEFSVKVIRARSRVSSDVEVIDIQTAGSGDLSITYNASGDQIVDIEGNYSKLTINNADDALDAIQGIHEALGINNPYEELQTFLATSDSYGSEYSFQQVYKGIKVFGRSIMTSTNASGEGNFLHSSFLASSVLDSADMRINLSASEAENRAKANYSGNVSADTARTERIVYSLEDYEDAPVYAYIVRVYGITGGNYIDDSIFVNAGTGKIIKILPNTCNAILPGNIVKAHGVNEFGKDVSFDVVYEFGGTLLQRLSYFMRDSNLHIQMNNSISAAGIPISFLNIQMSPIDNMFNEWTDAHQVSVYSNMREIMKWWKVNFNRDSLDGNGTMVDVVTHAHGKEDNAEWNNFLHRILTYDRATVSSYDHFCGADVDTLTHETTHAVMQYITGNHLKENAAGAINEGYADIFACIKDEDWKLGERLFDNENEYNLNCMRNIATPNTSGAKGKPYQLYTPLETIYADYKKGGEDDNGYTHQRCFKVSHAAYLMHVSNDVNGLTWKELGDVWYKSMHKGLNATSKFEDVRRCVLWAASELHLPYSKIAIIDSAFSQLGYGSNASLTGKVTDYDTHLPIPGVLISATVGSVNKNIFADDNGNFSITFPQGNCALEIVNYGYVTFSTNLKLENINSWNGKELNVQMIRPGAGSISGIINRLTIPATPFEGVTLKIRTNWNNQEGEPILTTTTDANGKYSFDLGSNGAGYYTIEMIKDGYETSTFNVIISGATKWQSEYLIGEEKPIINPISPDIPVSPDVSVVSGDIPIDEEHFPDEIFRSYVRYHIDNNNDNLLSKTEIEKTTRIPTNSTDYLYSLSSLKGIEYFTALQYLDCHNIQTPAWNYTKNQLTELDLSHNTALTYLNCSHNPLNILNVRGCTALTELECSNNQLTKLNVSENIALTRLNCEYNQLTELNVSENTALTELNCYNNQLTKLDVSRNTALTTLGCSHNQLTKLDVSHNTVLTTLGCGSNQLTKLDVSRNSALNSLWCDSNQLTELDVSNHTVLTDLVCEWNQLKTLNVKGCSALTTLRCSHNQLTKLDVSHNVALDMLLCYLNQLTALDVSHNTALTELECEYNQLTVLDVSRNTALISLVCISNQLTELDVSHNVALTNLRCENNQLTTLDLSKNTALTTWKCDSGVYVIRPYRTASTYSAPITFSQSDSTINTNHDAEILAVLPAFTPAQSGTYTFTVSLDRLPPEGSTLILLSDSEDIHGNFKETESPLSINVSANFIEWKTYTPIVVATSENQSGGCNTVTMKIVLLAGVIAILAKKS